MSGAAHPGGCSCRACAPRGAARCRDYRATFEALAAQFAAQADFAWIDIEDEADALGDLDIETFPTLLIADGSVLRFLGPVTPQAADRRAADQERARRRARRAGPAPT